MFKRAVTWFGDAFAKLFLAELFKLLILPTVIGAGLIVWELVREGWSPLGVMVGLGAVAFALIISERVTSYHKRLEESPIAWKDRRLERTLREWADDFRFLVGSRETHQGESFRFVAKKVFTINIVGTPKTILIVINWRIDQAYPKTFPQLIKEKIDGLHESLGMELLRHGIGFEITEDLSTVTLMHQLPRDNSLTQFVFQESLSFMHRARLLAAQIVANVLGDAGPETGGGSATPHNE